MKTFSIFATHFTINRDPFFYVNHVSKAAGRWLFHYCFIDCLWSEAISFVRCFVNLEMMVVLLPLELHLLWTSRVLTIILWFLKMLSYPYLGPSHFRYPQYKEKVSHLKNKKKLVVLGNLGILIYFWLPQKCILASIKALMGYLIRLVQLVQFSSVPIAMETLFSLNGEILCYF